MDCIKDLQDAIRNILVNNGLTELCLGEPDELDDPTYIIWYDMFTLFVDTVLVLYKI